MFSSHASLRSSAKVVDGNLIISMPDAKDPVVWRMALGEARAAALEVQTRGDEHYVLVLKYPKGDAIDIAPFDTKKAATGALMAVSQAMQNAQGRLSSARHHSAQPAIDDAAPRRSGGWKWLLPLGAILLALIIFARSGPQLPVDAQTAPQGAPETATPQNGVPQSADSFLNGM